MPLAGGPTPLIFVDRTLLVPISHQIYQRVREAVLAGQLQAGDPIPSSRALAKELRLARKTVQDAYAQLIAEGYIEGTVGSGTRVAPAVSQVTANQLEDARVPSAASFISRRGAAIVEASALIYDDPSLLPFRPCVPAVDAFPYALWARMLGRSARSTDIEDGNYRDRAGYVALREQIAMHLRTSRAVQCEANNIVVTDGTQQAFGLAARVLLNDQDSIWFEDPGYSGARAAFIAAGLRVLPVPVDDEGLNVEAARRHFPRACAAYVTPSHQYPTGCTMSLRRRLALLSWAREQNAWIFEDDYDSEYRYDGKPLGALQGISRGDRVIYFGTFSKVLLPSLRLGYVVAPADIARHIAAARSVTVGSASPIQQVALAHLMSEGHFTNHIRKMRDIYEERQSVLLKSLRSRLGRQLEVKKAGAGMHLAAYFNIPVNDMLVSSYARTHGIVVRALSSEAVGKEPPSGLVLGYGAAIPSIIDESVAKLKASIDQARRAM